MVRWGHDRHLPDPRPGTLPSRTLGTGGAALAVSAVGFGGMSVTDAYGPADAVEAEAVLRRALELGVTLFDTADVYGHGRNEELFGRVLGPHRDEIVLASKFGLPPAGGHPDGRPVDGRPEYVRAAVDASLRRLGTDRLDLYYLHRVDPRCRSRTRSARSLASWRPGRSAASVSRSRPPRPCAARTPCTP